MAKSAAASIEVQFRAAGTNDNWSDIQTFKPGQEVLLSATYRAASYEARARAVSRCGAKSAWAPASVTVTDANQRVQQSNINMLTIGGIRSAWASLAISYTATPTSATISCTAGTLRDGGFNPSYAASSVTVSGSASTSATFWLYYDDPKGLGGTFPLGATTVYENLSSSGSRVWVGNVTVTFPASGSSGGGGGTGGGGIGCPDENALVLVIDVTGAVIQRRAGDVVPGDVLWGADEATLEPKLFTVSYSERKLQPGVEVNTDAGGRIRCSASAPLPTPGGLRTAPNVAGHSVGHRADVGSAAAWDPVTTIRGLGHIWVQHIAAEEGCFWVSSDGGRSWILHHNLKQVP